MSDDQHKEILARLERIECILNPPLWKKITKWILKNILLITLLIFIAILVWKIWGIVNNVLEFTESIKSQIEALYSALNIESLVDSITFWE